MNDFNNQEVGQTYHRPKLRIYGSISALTKMANIGADFDSTNKGKDAPKTGTG